MAEYKKLNFHTILVNDIVNIFGFDILIICFLLIIPHTTNISS